ncbi:hypothetical protein J8J14_23235 [Roseomonas sp. SSH11]|uniref:Uncharacterized protein n=2 Tax=Pararoseomonas baculiformis TaxID=2820812 RepID=A0ABS4AKW3_9PROT|nr:hypothetical protein [Pararoseomonas baculiformis]
MNLPEIRESEAPPDVAAIYAEIRAVSGLPLVNLIWRHFAALPGVLPSVWSSVRPIVGSTEMDAARRRLAAAVPSHAKSTADWRLAGCGEADLERIRAIVGAYTRGNLTNLLALTALRIRLAEPDAPQAPPLQPAPIADALPALDALPSLNELPPRVADEVRALAARHGVPEGVIPSLYLHLAHWPGVLRLLPDWLSPLFTPGTLEEARGTVRRLAEHHAASMLPGRLVLPAGTEIAVRRALDEFTGRVIPDLLPVCLALGRLCRAS